MSTAVNLKDLAIWLKRLAEAISGDLQVLDPSAVRKIATSTSPASGGIVIEPLLSCFHRRVK